MRRAQGARLPWLGIAGCMAAALALAGCAGGPKRSKVEQAGNIRDTTMSRQQLEELSNAFADRYFTLMLAASERIMRDNPDLQQRRIMNGLRLLGVSSMYDIATSPDTLTQLLDQMGVVTLQNYYWADSGRARALWGDRAIHLVQALRRAREDIWELGARVFTPEQLEEIDLLISTWWHTQGGTEFVAYVRFSEIATRKGRQIVDDVRSGGGLLEPFDKATEQLEEVNLAGQRAFFWAKRVPLFANWQAMALAYDIISLPEAQNILGDADRIAEMVATLPEEVEAKGALAKEIVAEVRGSMRDAGVLLDKVVPIVGSVQGISQETSTALARVNDALAKVKAMQDQAAAAAPKDAPPARQVDIAEYGALLEQVRQSLVEANAVLASADAVTDEKRVAAKLKPVEDLIQLRIREVEQATLGVVQAVFLRVAILLAALVAAVALIMRWRRTTRS